MSKFAPGYDRNRFLRSDGDIEFVTKVDSNSVNVISWQVCFENAETGQSFSCNAPATGLFPGRLGIDERYRMSKTCEKISMSRYRQDLHQRRLFA